MVPARIIPKKMDKIEIFNRATMTDFLGTPTKSDPG